jgi:septum formation protein
MQWPGTVPHPRLILGSSSPHRRLLLTRFGIPFEVAVPDIDESAQPGETPETLVDRLARRKAVAVAERHPDAIVIGSDQVAVLDGEIYGKPHTHDRAIDQLSRASGRVVRFLTAVCVCAPGARVVDCVTVPTDVRFRDLGRAEIEDYLAQESVLACAGSFQSEGLGISLCESLRSDDPTALVGLPLITLRRLLAAAGLVVPVAAAANTVARSGSR